jgi:L-ascorbate metabolism protein UlaG (beta-lactamase superfamily)
MSEQKFYLRPDVQVEPLFNQWYVYPLLIAPATAAMTIANSHLKIMKSYVSAPDVHVAAVKNPAMRGGPFMDFDRDRTQEIRVLTERIVREQSHMIDFANAVKNLNELLLSQAKGYSLEPLYRSVPEPLKGYVELVYDLNNQPSIRFIERLLYESRYFDRSSQSIALSITKRDDRAFAFSTPRLHNDQELHLQVPFHSQGIDELFKMRAVRQSPARLEEAMNIPVEDHNLFSSFLTSEEPAASQKYDSDRVRIRYFGHASVLIETKDVSILTDPVISYSYDDPFFRYTYLDLPERLDYLVITHGHADHFMLETLLQLRHKAKHIIVPRNGGGALEDPSLKLALENVGFRNVIEIDEMETIPMADGKITSLPFLGEHADLNIRAKNAYLIHLGGKSIICAADSSNLEPHLYKHLHNQIGDIDVLFIGMECDGAPLSWIYGSLQTKPLERKMDRSRKLSGSDYERGIEIVNQFNCKQVYVYAMGQEPWLGYVTSINYTEDSTQIIESNKLVDECRKRGIEAERLYGAKEIFL